MPWQTCLVCPHYPFPSLLLLDPPALWQLSPPVNHAAMSHATPLQYHLGNGTGNPAATEPRTRTRTRAGFLPVLAGKTRQNEP